MNLAGQVRQAAGWSAVSTIVLRAGSLAVGIALARLLSPKEFGIYAVALTVQAVLMTLADFGLSTDLVRCDDPKRRAPTVATLGLILGGSLAGLMALTASSIAGALASPDSTTVIGLLSLTLLMAGAGVVPFARLQREFRQRALFGISLADFVTSTTLTIGLVLAGWGVLALAVGRIAAQAVSLVLQFVIAGERPRYGFDRALAPSIIAFGLPVALANLLSWALLSIDNAVVVRSLGPVQLGLYVLAFNVSSWPMGAVGQVVRSVALPAFSRTRVTRPPGPPREDRVLGAGLSVAAGIALPAGALLAALSSPLIVGLYGARWQPAAAALVGLGLFGSARVIFDLIAAYLLAQGRSRPVLLVQLGWLAALVPALVLLTRQWGIAGAGVAQLAVAIIVAFPAYLLALHHAGVALRPLLQTLIRPALGAAAVAASAAMSAAPFMHPWAALPLGGLVGTVVATAIVLPAITKRVRALRAVNPVATTQPQVPLHPKEMP